MKKHILVVASTFPAHDGDSVPAFVKDQIIAMRTLDPNLRFSVLAPHDARSSTKDFSKHPKYDEYRFHYFWPFSAEQLAGRGIMPALKKNPLNYLLIPCLFIGEFIALLRLTRKLRPDIVYAHWFTPQAIIACYASVFTRVPFVFTTHAADVDVWHKIPLIGEYIVRSSTKKAIRFTAVSRRSLGKLENFFPHTTWQKIQKNSMIIPMGVKLPATRKSTRPTSKTKTILFIGRLAEKKGVQYLLPAYAAVIAPTNHLIVAGDGPWLKKLKKQADTLDLHDYVSFPGYVSGAAKHDLIASADIFVIPSIITSLGDAEGMPVSLMEGLAYGKVCIATNESGADDIVTNGQDGFLVPQKNVKALTKSLQTALALQPQAIVKLSKAAQKTAQQFSWPSIAKRHIDFLFAEAKQ